MASWIVPLNEPIVVAVSWIVNEVDWPAASDVLPRLETRLKPLGIVAALSEVSVSVAVPRFVTVIVLVTGMPWVVVPKLTVPPSATPVPPIVISISGAVTVPESVKSYGFSLLSLLASWIGR